MVNILSKILSTCWICFANCFAWIPFCAPCRAAIALLQSDNAESVAFVTPLIDVSFINIDRSHVRSSFTIITHWTMSYLHKKQYGCFGKRVKERGRPSLDLKLEITSASLACRVGIQVRRSYDLFQLGWIAWSFFVPHNYFRFIFEKHLSQLGCAFWW